MGFQSVRKSNEINSSRFSNPPLFRAPHPFPDEGNVSPPHRSRRDTEPYQGTHRHTEDPEVGTYSPGTWGRDRSQVTTLPFRGVPYVPGRNDTFRPFTVTMQAYGVSRRNRSIQVSSPVLLPPQFFRLRLHHPHPHPNERPTLPPLPPWCSSLQPSNPLPPTPRPRPRVPSSSWPSPPSSSVTSWAPVTGSHR